jgi:N-terminal domain of anti-restriction factor ArdC
MVARPRRAAEIAVGPHAAGPDEEVMMRHRRQLTEEERDRRRAEDRERLRAAAEQLLSSEGWQRWVRARASSGLARYSLSNQLLVALQSGGRATFVAGFKQWLALGYCVTTGQRALRVMAPMTVKERDRQTGGETGETITLFKAVPVFFQEQVEPLPSGEPVSLQPPREPLTGDSHSHLLPRLQAFCESLGYRVSFEVLDGPAGGWCDRRAKRIVVDAQAPGNGQLRTLVHETAHALGVDYQRYSRQQSEVLADTITFVACSSVGLAVDGESIPYVAGWGEEGALDAATEFASMIDGLARRIEDALGSEQPVADEAQSLVAG